MRPPSKSAALQDGDISSISAEASKGGSQDGKRKGKTPKFDRLRVTGTTCIPAITQHTSHAVATIQEQTHALMSQLRWKICNA